MRWEPPLGVSRSVTFPGSALARVCALVWLIPLGVGCAGAGGQADDEPEGARTLPLGSPLRETFECGERGPDCVDWYVVSTDAAGTLRLYVAAFDDSAAQLQLQMYDQAGNRLGETPAGPSLELRRKVPAGRYWLEVKALVPTASAEYAIEAVAEGAASNASAGAPGRTRRWPVLELDDRGERLTVLIGAGADHGLEAGQRGRLVDRGRGLAKIRIMKVFAEGARAEIEGPLAAPVTPTTEAEVELPPGR